MIRLFGCWEKEGRNGNCCFECERLSRFESLDPRREIFA